MDGYVSDIDTIYETELSEHYWNLWIDRIKQMVKQSLDWCLPNQFFSCSSSGTRERYMNMIHIYNLIQKFFESFPVEMEWITALSELHAWWPYTKIFSSLWAKSIWIREQHHDVIHSEETYRSDIFVHEMFWEKCKKAFSGVDRKSFIASLK